jgi:NADH:ubiquinone oxidoreductase subunit F (NADH-binding)
MQMEMSIPKGQMEKSMPKAQMEKTLDYDPLASAISTIGKNSF